MALKVGVVYHDLLYIRTYLLEARLMAIMMTLFPHTGQARHLCMNHVPVSLNLDTSYWESRDEGRCEVDCENKHMEERH